ncbi:hypothetical protein JOD54_003134 [Actinokineospora baliensis]|uniref:SMI1/KNR4 family protein n=1 Tax=Actinokineospora baliensis TaxID=547056 RepID=UPI00195DE9F6|nr:SMI1/KNR4 family protein [Actinokineospora baliensis]MBM7772930.1 hypothetical protein [Actinokineospora baliensis]
MDAGDFFDFFESQVRLWQPDAAFSGLSDEKIDEIRADQGVGRLPSYYMEFLRRMGGGAGGFLQGTDVFYPEVIGVPADTRELLAENGAGHLLSSDAVVFAIHGGYLAYWFDVGSENPPVILYREGSSEILRTWESFSVFLLDELARCLRRIT